MKKYLRYIITFAVGLVAAFIICLCKNIFSQTSLNEIFKILVDALFASGTVILGFGLLVVATNGGTFDMLAYGAIMFVSLFNKGTQRKYKTFYDYHEAQKDRKYSFAYLLIVGGILIVASLILLIFWYRTK